MAVRRTTLQRSRNIGIMAHIDAGKTTVSERILFYSGRTHRMAEVHDGLATMDWMAQERERGITISSAVSQVQWKNHEIYLIDTPGHVDFTVEVERSLRVLDGVVAVFDAVSGVEPQSETVWYQADRHRVPRLGFANKMDRVGASFDRCLDDVRTLLGAHPIAVQLPIGSEQHFAGVVDLMEMEALYFEEKDQGATIVRGEIPEALQGEASAARERMIEALADVDDEVALAYLEALPLSTSVLKAALRRATIALQAVPFLCGSGLRNKGIQPLIDAVVDYLPAPDDLPPLRGHDFTGAEVVRERSVESALAALAFKIQVLDGRKLVFFRIYSGEMRDGESVLNATQNQSFRVKNLFRMHANRSERITVARAGEIVAMVKARAMVTGDTICAVDAPIILERIEARAPVISVAIEPETVREREKLTEALATLTEEDPTLVVEEDSETGELLMRGMGELHLEIVCDRLQLDFGVAVRRGNPNVVCRETVTQSATGRGTFSREVDAERLYGEVEVVVRPRGRGAGNHCEVDLVSSQPFVKPEVIDAALEGVRDGMLFGPGGEEMTDVEVVVRAIGVDAKGGCSAIATRVAAGEAVRNAYRQAGPVVLEPLMTVDVVVAEEHIGDIISDFASRRGVVEAVDTSNLRTVVHGVVPLRNMFGYAMRLRSMTHGRGAFSMKFKSFDQLS